MKPTSLILLILVIAIPASSTHAGKTADKIHPLRPQDGSGGHRIPGVSCLSWRLAVETDNIRDWDLVPWSCEGYVGHYMLGHQYRKDCNAAAWAAYDYAKGLTLKIDGKDVAKEYNETTFKEWEMEGKAPAVPAILGLYKRLLKLGFKIVFISGKSESLRSITVYNMKKVGYHTWEKLILKQTSESGTTAMVYKSKKRKELEEAGYRILGNMGDQWSDLLGTHVGNRTFKVPNPMFYIA